MSSPSPATPASTKGLGAQTTPPQENQGLTEGQKRAIIVAAIIFGIVVATSAIWGAVTLVNHPAQAATMRDVFIIFMALESMVIGVALVVLIFQLAVLTNMLKHEIKPILESTQETANTVRGTTVFVSQHLVEPIMQLNSYVAGLTRLLESLGTLGGLIRRK